MKIIITESQLKSLEELGGQFKEETEIIYRDKNIVCFVPKSQMSSKMLGKGTNWCSTSKIGFEMWGERGLFIRFIFRGGKKIRVTYMFDKIREGEYNWANENGWHTLEGEGNPFKPKFKNTGYENEKDVFEHIKKIPEGCKKAVLNFIKKNKEGYDYCHKDKEYYTKSEILLKSQHEILRNIINTYEDAVDAEFKMYPRKRINAYYRSDEKKYQITTTDYFKSKDGKQSTETFDKFDVAKKYLLDLCQQAYNEHTRKFQPQSDFWNKKTINSNF